MACLVGQRHSVASRIHGSASLLLIQSLYGSWIQTGALSLGTVPLKSQTATGHYTLLDQPTLLDDIQVHHDFTTNTPDLDDTCDAGLEGHRDGNDFIIIGLGSPMDQECNVDNGHCGGHGGTSDCKSSACQCKAQTAQFTVTILPGVVYNFSDMILHLNIQISPAAVAVLMCYLAVTLCGLYRFVEIIQEYCMGCRCRICKREFRIVRSMEGGAYGRILLARYIGAKKDFDFEVILKSIPIEGVSAISVTQQECRKLLSLNHRYVMKYYDDFLHREWGWNPLLRANLYCVMVTEFCERGSLADLIEQEYSKFTEEYIISIFKKVVMALQYVHEQSVIHRDIKSPNIMLKSNDVVRLGDFGLSDTFAAKKACKKVKCGNMLEIAAMAEKNNRRRGMQQDVTAMRGRMHDDDDQASCYGNASPEDTDPGVHDQQPGNRRRAHKRSASYNQESRPQDYFAIPDVRFPQTTRFRSTKRTKGNRKRQTLGPDMTTDGYSYGVPAQQYEDSYLRGDPSVRERPAPPSSNDITMTNDHIIHERSDSTSEQIGTNCYMAPEIRMHSIYGRSSDIWALGCVLLEMCSGVFMWELGYNLGDCPEKVQSLVANLPPMISKGTRSLITKTLSVDPEKRPSATQILASRCLKVNAKRYSKENLLDNTY